MTNSDKKIIHIALATPLRQQFDYLPPKDTHEATLKIGMRVLVPFGKQKKVGIILGIDEHSDYDPNKLKKIEAILEDTPLLDPSIMKLCEWASRYYQHSLGEVLHAALPTLARKAERISHSANESFYVCGQEALPKLTPRQRALHETLINTPGLTGTLLKQEGFSEKLIRTLMDKGLIISKPTENSAPSLSPSLVHSELQLNEAQKKAVDAINQSQEFSCFLLNGITGSGKTEVYLQTIAQRLQAGQQAIILVPEIGLTPQTIARFRTRFNVPIVALHSKLSEKDRLHAWFEAQSGRAKIIIGTRSAIFTPAPHLGIVILDEEHDLSFKQQSRFRYSARDLGIMRCKLLNIPIIMGSATPSLESLYNVQQKRFTELQLPNRAGSALVPQYQVIDLRRTHLKGALCPELISAIQQHLAENNQVLIFLNRRGFAPLILCHDCGWTADCPHCDAKLTFHQQKNKLCCHHCGTERRKYTNCLKCQSNQLINIGLGTERLEQQLSELFPSTEIIRIDQDTTRNRKNALPELIERIQSGQKQILIGTQMLAKGHHFPNVTLVGLIDVDNALFSSDFRALERLGQLIIQVSGRAGRAQKPGTVFIQTHNPEHPSLNTLLTEGYQKFAASLLEERQTLQLPPFSYLAILQAESSKAHQLNEFLRQIKSMGLSIPTQRALKIIGPLPAPMGRKAGRDRAQLIIQADQRQALQHWLALWIQEISKNKLGQRLRWVVDVDPLEM